MPDFPPLVIAIEGDYSSFSFKWKQALAAGEGTWGNKILRVDEALDKIFIEDQAEYYITERKLSDGSAPSVTSTISRSLYDGAFARIGSVLRKYFAYVVAEAGVPKLKIFKDGSLLQTIDLSLSPILWTDTTVNYYVDIAPNGKYILVENNVVDEYALFEGS
jgi:hypothetical protein